MIDIENVAEIRYSMTCVVSGSSDPKSIAKAVTLAVLDELIKEANVDGTLGLYIRILFTKWIEKQKESL